MVIHSLSSHGWIRSRPALAWESGFGIVLIAMSLALYLPVLAGLVSTWWSDPSATYGFLIPPLALSVGWMRRADLQATPAQSEFGGLFLVGAACAVFLVGKIGAGAFLSRWSLILFVTGIVWTLWGRRRLRLLLFPIVLLATMIPGTPIINSQVSLRLQILSSSLAAPLARSFGVTIYREGNQLYLAHIRLGVAEACSGLHSISALLVAALLLASIYCTPWRRRILLLAISIPITILANVTRITATAVIADRYPQVASGFYHSLSGFLAFLVSFVLLWLFARMSDPGLRRTS